MATVSEEIITKKVDSPFLKKEIQYEKASFVSRVFANAIDIILFFFVSLICFTGTRAICVNTNQYKQNDNELISYKLESGLFERDSKNQIKDTITIIEESSEYTVKAKYIKSKNVITNFYSFISDKVSSERYDILLNDFDTFRLDSKMLLSDSNNVSKPMFLNNGNAVIENPELVTNDLGNGSPVYKSFYENCYKKFIDNNLQKYFLSELSRVGEIQIYESNVLLYGEILPALLIGFLLVYLVPAIINKHGRQTIGKLVYHIGSVDASCLSPSFTRYLAKLGLILFEFITAIFTFGCTLIISFTMMAFSKKKQAFPDYVLDLNDVKTTNCKIYMSITEAEVDNAETHKKPINFNTKNFD